MGHQTYGQLLHCMYTLQVSLELVTSSKIVAVPNPRRLVSRYRVRDMVIELLSFTFLPHLFTLSGGRGSVGLIICTFNVICIVMNSTKRNKPRIRPGLVQVIQKCVSISNDETRTIEQNLPH